MDYIEQLISGNIQPSDEQISLEDYLKETVYITKFMSPKIKATNIATYHAMFYLSYGKNGIGSFSIPWPEIGSLCGNERGTGVLTKNEAIRERTKALTNLGCIKIQQNRRGVNDFYVFLPSEISFVKEAIKKDLLPTKKNDISKNIDCYNNQERKLKILLRDNSICQYCLASLTDKTYYLDHIVPRSKNGSNYKNNLIASCQTCNSNKSNSNVKDFLLTNYRNGLLKQKEYTAQTEYIKIITDSGTSEP
jgi:hypothetical protein